MSKTKEKLYQYQEDLERQHREEEDRLMAQFHQERLEEAESMQKEFDSEWEKQLQALTDQFDGSAPKKKDRTVRNTTSQRVPSMIIITHTHPFNGWLASRVVNVLDSGAEGPGFKSQLRRCRVTVLGKLFTPIVPLFTKQRNW